MLEVSHFTLSVYKSTKHFGLSFAMSWSDLPDDVHSATSLSSHRKKLKTSIFLQMCTHSFFFFFWGGCLIPAYTGSG